MKTTSYRVEKGYSERVHEERKLLLLIGKNAPAMMGGKQMEKTVG